MTTTANSTKSIVFKLHLAPGAVENISIKYSEIQDLSEELELKMGELGLNFHILYWKNEKGNLISLGSNVQKILKSILKTQTNSASIYAIPDSSDSSSSSDSSDSSSGEGDFDDDEAPIVDSTPKGPRHRRCGRRNRSRSRGFDRSRSRSHSRTHKKKMFKRFFKRSHENSELRGKRHCMGGRCGRSESPRRPEWRFRRHGPHEFGCRFEEFGRHPRGFGFGDRHHHHHPFGPFARRGFEGFHGFGRHPRSFEGGYSGQW